MRAAAQLPSDAQLVLCAGMPDTPEIMAEVESLMTELQASREGIVWIPETLPRDQVIAILTASTVFVCPSVYEPLGIVNLEAMACELPVVATATGGIPEVVVPGETGWLVLIEQVTDGTGTPVDPKRFVDDLAAALNDAVTDPERARQYGLAGRRRAVEEFSGRASVTRRWRSTSRSSARLEVGAQGRVRAAALVCRVRGLGCTNMSDVLAFAGVSVVRGSNRLLDDVTWEVEEGERWVILGPNGAGKTTLLNSPPAACIRASGTVTVLGEVLGPGRRLRAAPSGGLSARRGRQLPSARRSCSTVWSPPRTG